MIHPLPPRGTQNIATLKAPLWLYKIHSYQLMLFDYFLSWKAKCKQNVLRNLIIENMPTSIPFGNVITSSTSLRFVSNYDFLNNALKVLILNKRLYVWFCYQKL